MPWELLRPDGESFAAGTDILNLDSDGRIASITAFVDRAPEGFGDDAHDNATD